MSRPIIVVEDLSKSFGEIHAVRQVSFSVPRGEIFAFLGPNGAGKTTTIRMLTTLLQPTSGRAELNGFDVARDPHNVRRSFGIIFQDPSLDSDLTAFENMEIHAVLYSVAPAVYRERIPDLMKLVGLWDRKDDLIKTFSGGMKRRLEIARGLLHHPTILFLDEPTLGLDPQTRNHMWNYVRDLRDREQITVFFTTHYMEEADRNADRIAIIDNGTIVAIGTSAALKEQTGGATLEDAFLALTGKSIREESAENPASMMFQMMRGKSR